MSDFASKLAEVKALMEKATTRHPVCDTEKGADYCRKCWAVTGARGELFGKFAVFIPALEAHVESLRELAREMTDGAKAAPRGVISATQQGTAAYWSRRLLALVGSAAKETGK